MIQKASNEVGFEAEDIPLMVEAIPLSSESVMLVITKVDDPEEMDTRFSKFAPSPENDIPDNADSSVPSTLEGADRLMQTGAVPRAQSADNENESRIRIFSFDSLDQAIRASGAVKNLSLGRNTLYKNPQDARYYLLLENDGKNAAGFTNACNMLQEYGRRIRHTYSSESYCKEHYEVIIHDHALQSLSRIG